MSFDTYFRASSYAMIAVAMLALVLAGGLHLGLALGFAVLMVVAWKLEGTSWQISERVGLLIVILSIPLFFLDWQYQKAMGGPAERLGVNALAHLIVFLSAIKLLQVKSDRDWVFLYLISFFEVLLAAGLSFSPVFLGTLSLYLLCALSTISAFEIRKAKRATKPAETRLLIPPDSSIFRKLTGNRPRRNIEATRLPLVAALLLLLIFSLALPLFLIVPRAGSATFSRGRSGISNFIGFSENVTLGQIGELKENNEVVMRVRIEESQTPRDRSLKWRGVALDEFTGQSWKKSSEARILEAKIAERGFFRLGTTEALHRLTTQTVFLEPIESNVLFAASRLVAVQGEFPFIRVDGEAAIQSGRHNSERLIYKALSDTNIPDIQTLRSDRRPLPRDYRRYLQLPAEFDPRITELAGMMISAAGARTRYDAAKAIESALQRDYGYALQMRASGPDPLSDFLFNIRAGHCEYFSTAMAVMLRTHGIPARVVNGFLPGEYNTAAGAFTVRQSDAHSWVEVYFPSTDTWVEFDPTPAAGRIELQRTGFIAQLQKYAEAMELMWFQYVVGYDKQEQRSLATSLHNLLFDSRRAIGQWIAEIRKIEIPASYAPLLIPLFLALLMALWILARRIRNRGWAGLVSSKTQDGLHRSSIEFYERLIQLLAMRGISRRPDQTPLEFATSLGQEVPVRITQAYHRVRYGANELSFSEANEIENWLQEMEKEAPSLK
ncbi:MAG TPA: DUF3488 and transglutaminase-like domain-containing protein [Pyrinomonadaceae bacterium]|nr:DUF3488 and transglutaminase-like domain-containing protein [Pyrinomonadaceae bacterium]